MSLSSHVISDLHKRSTADDKRKAVVAVDALVDRLFTQQKDFVMDPARFKSARCPRRSGKTYACIVALYRKALELPKANCLYLTLTRGQAFKNVWLPLRNLSDEFELGVRFHGTNLVATLPNGSRISLAGAETRQEIDKLRGQAYDLVIIDECKSFAPDVMVELISEVLKPALNDRMGSLMMIGTPGNILVGPFYEATTEGFAGVRPWHDRKRKGRYRWSFHRWNTQDNIALPHLWEASLEDKAANGWADDDPRWVREYLGEWCPSDDVMVYALNTERNCYEGGLPDGHEWKYLLGCDFGFEDPFALVVAAYSETCPVLYHVWDYKQPHLTVQDMAKAIKATHDKFGSFDAMVADAGGLGKTLVATLGEQYGYNFIAADKKEKHDHIELLNSDLISAKVKLNPDSHLVSEMRILQWKDSAKKAEDPMLDNHCCFLPGTLVLTDSGYKRIEQVFSGDMVLTHMGRYRRVKASLSRDYAGKVITLATPVGDPITCTPEHELWAARVKKDRTGTNTGQLVQDGPFGWHSALEIASGKFAIGTQTFNNLPGTEHNNYECLTMGYYVAEGSLSQKAGQVFFAGHIDENRIIPLIEKAVGKKVGRVVDGNGRSLYVSSVALVNELLPLGKSLNKHFPTYISSLSPEQSLWMLAGYLYGDGHFSKASNAVKAGSISVEIANQAAQLARQAGITASVLFARRSGRWEGIRGLIKNNQWIFSTSGLDLVPRLRDCPELVDLFADKRNFERFAELNCDVRRVGQLQRSLSGNNCTTKYTAEISEYRGPVHTLSVEDDESYTVNGVTAKNCDAFLYLWRYAAHHYAHEARTALKYGTPEYFEQWDSDQFDQAIRIRRAKKNMDYAGRGAGEMDKWN